MTMPEQKIELLKQQIASLDTKKFDLEAWKSATLIFVSRIFGTQSEHVRQIRELKYDYSSWNLRDTSGGTQLTDPVRIRAREILDAAIVELQTLGTPKISTPNSPIMEVFQKEMTGKEMQELGKILSLDDDKKRQALKDFLDRDKKWLKNILLELLIRAKQL